MSGFMTVRSWGVVGCAAVCLVGTSLAASRAAETERQTVRMVFTKATVAGIPTIAVTNLPTDMIARPGDTLIVTIVNQSPLAEGFSIDAYNVHAVVQPHATGTVRLTALRSGSYPIYCQLHPYSVHRVGTLLVAP
jgi:nitrosocyanin